MANPWFRMYSEIIYNPKVQVLTEALRWRYVALLCLHCNGQYENTPSDEIALALRIDESEWLATRDVFIKRRLLDEKGRIAKWESRQYISDLKDPTAAKRQKRYRENKRNERNATVTSRPPESDTDTEYIEANASVADTSATPQKAACPAQAIVDLYHELMPDNPTVKVLNDQRRKLIRARWKEAAALTCEPFGYGDRESGLKAWRRFFTVCSQSDFLTGKAAPLPNKPPFVADIDFLMSPSGFAKCLENKYHRE